MKFSALALCSILLLTGSCSLPWSGSPKTKSNPTAEAMLKQGTDLLNNKRYSSAILQFERVLDEFPFSPQAAEVELKIAEAYYLNKRYPEATEAFKNYLALRPTNKNVPFVLYHLGLVHLDQFKSIDRDQKIIQTAKSYFETVIKDHPKSPYTADAKKKLSQCRQYLAEREFYVGSFYLKEKKYSAAKDRYETIVRHYLDTPLGVQALFQLGESYRLENNSVKAALAYEALIKHYPDSPLAEKARVQLSQLDKIQQDPLAQLLMRDGKSPFLPGTENGRLLTASGETQNRKELILVAKTDVVYEEEKVKKGFFRSLVSTINPFDSSSEDGKNGQQKDQKKPSLVAKTDVVHEEGGAQKGFFSRIVETINPFSSSSNNGSEISEAQAEQDGKLVGKIDQALRQKGIDTEGKEIVSQSPTPDLPKITEAPKPSNAKEVLSKIDEGLKKEGKNVSALPPPPKLTVTRRSKTKSKRKKTRTSVANSKLLGDIDKKLKKGTVEIPEEGEKTGAPGNLRASKPPSVPASQSRAQERV